MSLRIFIVYINIYCYCIEINQKSFIFRNLSSHLSHDILQFVYFLKKDESTFLYYIQTLRFSLKNWIHQVYWNIWEKTILKNISNINTEIPLKYKERSLYRYYLCFGHISSLKFMVTILWKCNRKISFEHCILS